MLKPSDVGKEAKEEKGRKGKKREEKGDERRNKFAPDPLDRLICPRGYCFTIFATRNKIVSTVVSLG